MPAKVRLERLPGTYAVSRLEPGSAIPDWADGAGFVSLSRSDDELSVVCRADRVPAGIKQDTGWACYKFVGPFAFDETGIVSSVPDRYRMPASAFSSSRPSMAITC